MLLRAHRSLVTCRQRCYSTPTATNAVLNNKKYEKSYHWARFELEGLVKQHGYLPGQQLHNIYRSFTHQEVLTSAHAVLLLRHCNKICADMNPSARTDLAQKIFSTAIDGSMGTHMYDKLLEAHLQNEHPFSTNDVLKELMDAGLQPSPWVYEKLIAQLCRDGDLEGSQHILQHMKAERMEIPRDVFGHIAHGKCLVGSPDEGFQIIKHMLEEQMKPTWRAMTSLCCGLAKVGETTKLHSTLSMIYNGYLRRPHIDHIINICGALLQTDKWEEAYHLQPYIRNLTPQCLSYASHHLKFYKNGPSLLEMFYKCLDSKQDFISTFPAKLYLQNTIRNAEESFAPIRECIDMLCEVHHQNAVMILREALGEVIHSKPQLVKQMLSTALEKDSSSVKAHMLLPIVVSSKVSDDIGKFLEETCPDLYNQLKSKELLNLPLPRDLNGILAEYQKIASNPMHYIKQAISYFLFGKETDLKKLAQVVVQIKPSNSPQDSMDNKQAILSVIMTELNERIYIPTEFVYTLHDFMKELHNQTDYPSEKGDSHWVFNTLRSDHHFLGQLLYETEANVVKMKTPEEGYNRTAQKYVGHSIKEGNVDVLLQNIDSGLKRIKINNKPTFLFTVVVDSYDRLPADKFASVASHVVNDPYLNKFLSADACNVVITHCIETGNISLLKKTQHHLNKSSYPMMNLIDSIPQHILKKMLTDADVHSSLMEHLSFLTYKNNAAWIVYFSLLKFRMTDDAEKFLAQNPNMSWTSMGTLNCFIEQVEKSQDIVAILYDVMKQCKNTPNFNSSPLIQACILSLLRKDMLNEAASVIDTITQENYSLPQFVKMTTLKKFASYGRKAPQVLDIAPELQALATEVSAQTLDVSKVLGLIEQLCAHRMMVPVNLLCEFLCRIPMQDYPDVKKHLKSLVPWFQPELQTSVLVSGVRKLVNLGLLDDVSKYMLQNFLSVDNSNYFLWQTSVDLLTEACCRTGNLDPLHVLVKSNLQPDLKDLIDSRLLYTNFKLNNPIKKESITPSTLFRLVSYVNRLDDHETMESLIEYSKQHFNVDANNALRWEDKTAKPSQILLVSSALASGYDIDRCKTLIKEFKISDKRYLALFCASIRRAYNTDFNTLESVDTLAREMVSNKVISLSQLNSEFLKKCSYIAAGTVYFDERMKSYLSTIFTSIPCDMHPLFTLQRYQRLMHSLQYRKSISNRAVHEESAAAAPVNTLFDSFVNKNNATTKTTTDSGNDLVGILNQRRADE